MSNVSDENLVAHFRDHNDQDAFTELTGRYRDELTRTAAHRLRGDWNAAEDVVQKTFINVFRYASKFDASKSSFRKWLLWWAVNTFRDEYRRRKKKANQYVPMQANEDAGDENLPESKDGDRIEEREFVSAFWRFVDSLPTGQRQAICLIFVEGLSYADASHTSGVRAPTLKKRVKLALTKMRETLTDCPTGLSVRLERRHAPRDHRLNAFYRRQQNPDDTFTIRQFVETLPTEQQSVCDLVCYQGLPVADVSDRLGLPDRTINHVMAAAIHGLIERVTERRRLIAAA